MNPPKNRAKNRQKTLAPNRTGSYIILLSNTFYNCEFRTPVNSTHGPFIRPATLRPHLRRTHQLPLAPDSGESTVQDGRAHVQGHSWNCAVIPESTGSCRRSAWSTFPPLCSDQSSAGAAHEAVYCRRPGLPGRRTHHLEKSAGQCDLCPVSVELLAFLKKPRVF